MPDRPLILFPSPERADREHKPPVFTRTVSPSFGKQFTRLQPSFTLLKTAFEQKALKIQQSPTGINPEFALVFEIIGTVDSFYTAVKNTDGLEWIFDSETKPFDPDDDFYQVDSKSGEKIENSLNGKLYCVMSNQQAMSQLLSLWQRYQNGETDVFKRGFAGLRDVFTKIKDLRKWDARDRIEETHALEYWRESLEFDGDSPVPFEIELFFRSDAAKRSNSAETIHREIQLLEGHVIQECIIDEIFYHGMLVELPRTSIESLVNQYEEIELSQVDDIMFFRPVCQSAFVSTTDSEVYTSTEEASLPTGDAVVAVFDGMPMQNHRLLRGRVIIDDPDDYATGYESKYRVHGTSMVSLAIYGGREFVRGRFDGKINWVESSREPGCLSAAPYGTGATDGCAFSFGTSDAAAQITHEAAKCHDVLNQIFLDETGTKMPAYSTAILLKAMLTHGASWESIADKIASSMETSPKKLSKWLGNGIPNISRVIECTKERITLIGLGALKKDEGDIFRLPLPVDFSSRLMKRKLTVTLAYLSPVVPNKQTYRGAQLWFNIDDGGKGLVPERQNTEWQEVRKGSLQHEIFTGENPIVWNDDDLIIKVNCREEAIKLKKDEIPYCIFVSFEVAEGFDVDLYADVSIRIRHHVQISSN